MDEQKNGNNNIDAVSLVPSIVPDETVLMQEQKSRIKKTEKTRKPQKTGNKNEKTETSSGDGKEVEKCTGTEIEDGKNSKTDINLEVLISAITPEETPVTGKRSSKSNIKTETSRVKMMRKTVTTKVEDPKGQLDMSPESFQPASNLEKQNETKTITKSIYRKKKTSSRTFTKRAAGTKVTKQINEKSSNPVNVQASILGNSAQVPENASINNPSVSTANSSANTFDLEVSAVCENGKPLQLSSLEDHAVRTTFAMLKECYGSIFGQLSLQLPSGHEQNASAIETLDILQFLVNYNAAIIMFHQNKYSKNIDLPNEWKTPECTMETSKKITEFAYRLAIPDPKKLNTHYKGFTSEVYGETTLEQMALILDKLNLNSDDVLVDLGSGVGQLISFSAAYTNIKKAVGIELSSIPATYAINLETYFKKLMSHFGKRCSDFELIKGDFLDPKFYSLICEQATVIFINNYAFTPELTRRIVFELLQNCAQGTRIITAKPLTIQRTGSRRRDMEDFGSMSHSVELECTPLSNVSWTQNKVIFTLTTVDHLKMAQLVEEKTVRKRAPATKTKRVVKKRKEDEQVQSVRNEFQEDKPVEEMRATPKNDDPEEEDENEKE